MLASCQAHFAAPRKIYSVTIWTVLQIYWVSTKCFLVLHIFWKRKELSSANKWSSIQKRAFRVLSSCQKIEEKLLYDFPESYVYRIAIAHTAFTNDLSKWRVLWHVFIQLFSYTMKAVEKLSEKYHLRANWSPEVMTKCFRQTFCYILKITSSRYWYNFVCRR